MLGLTQDIYTQEDTAPGVATIDTFAKMSYKQKMYTVKKMCVKNTQYYALHTLKCFSDTGNTLENTLQSD